MDERKFKVGDKVRTIDHARFGTNNGVVYSTTESCVSVEFPGSDRGHGGDFNDERQSCWNFFPSDTRDDEDSTLHLLVSSSTPSVASDLRLKPQSKTILRHLKKRKSISPAEALITYGISRLAACIYDIRQIGYDVIMQMRQDEQGHKYAHYSLAKVK